LVYRIKRQTVEIARVWHPAQDWRKSGPPLSAFEGEHGNWQGLVGNSSPQAVGWPLFTVATRRQEARDGVVPIAFSFPRSTDRQLQSDTPRQHAGTNACAHNSNSLMSHRSVF